MIIKGIVNPLLDLIEKAEMRTIEGIREGRLETEPDITNRFIQAVEDLVNGEYENKGIKFKTRTLRDRGPKSPESKYGADLVGVLDVRLKGYQLSKGFLMQAKMECDWAKLKTDEYESESATFKPHQEFSRLQGQIDEMLKITPDSFVFIYGQNNFSVIPGSSVNGLQRTGRLYGKTIKAFFKDFFTCFIGDPQLNAWNDSTLERLKERRNARTAMMIQIFDIPNSESDASQIT